MKVGTIRAKLSLGSELVDWYRDATSVPYGHLFIDLSPRRDDRLCYCTSRGSITSKTDNPERFKHLNSLEDEHTKTLFSPNVPVIFPRTHRSFASILPERVYPVSLRLHSKSAQRKPAKHKTSQGQISKRISLDISKNNLEAKTRNFSIRRRLTAYRSHYSSRQKQFVLVWSGFFRLCLRTTTRV